MTRKAKAAQEAEERLHRAEAASEVVEEQGNRVKDRLNLVDKLRDGWREVHKYNHLAHLFEKEWGQTR